MPGDPDGQAAEAVALILGWDYLDATDLTSEATCALRAVMHDCVLPGNVRQLAARMPAAELVWGEESQIDYYDQLAQIDFAVAASAKHFRAHLPEGA